MAIGHQMKPNYARAVRLAQERRSRACPLISSSQFRFSRLPMAGLLAKTSEIAAEQSKTRCRGGVKAPASAAASRGSARPRRTPAARQRWSMARRCPAQARSRAPRACCGGARRSLRPGIPARSCCQRGCRAGMKGGGYDEGGWRERKTLFNHLSSIMGIIRVQPRRGALSCLCTGFFRFQRPAYARARTMAKESSAASPGRLPGRILAAGACPAPPTRSILLQALRFFAEHRAVTP